MSRILEEDLEETLSPILVQDVETEPVTQDDPQGDPQDDPFLCASVEDVLPERFRAVFPFRFFNRVQTSNLHAYTDDTNLVVSAPTGSGKTAIFELAICRAIESMISFQGEYNIVYLAPTKALCAEVAGQWRAKFGALGLAVGEVTGDSGATGMDAAQLDIVCTTPEKWTMLSDIDLICQFGIASKTALLIIDEIHNLGEGRGDVLEAVISRVRLTHTLLKLARSDSAAAARLRIVAGSATIPNVEDIRDWFSPCRASSFGSEARPSELTTRVLGYNEGNPYLFEGRLTQRLPEVIRRYGEGKPCLVFCPSRKSSAATAVALAETHGGSVAMGLGGGSGLPLGSCRDTQLRRCLARGVGFHNATMTSADRQLVEELFRTAAVPILCSTTTLAQGVNLPAHLVVVKSTQVYRGGGMTEYEPSLVLQMLGRAGRPQFDRSGVAVIMTRKRSVEHYELLAQGAHEAVESRLRSSFVEHVNAEVCRGTIHDISGALFWLRETFFWVRMKRNPSHYFADERLSAAELEAKAREMCLEALDTLRGAEMLSRDDDDVSVAPTEVGKVMARHLIAFDSMLLLRGLFEVSSPGLFLLELCRAKELREIVLRRSEKKLLNEINKGNPYPLGKKERVRGAPEKVFVLIQAHLADSEHLVGNGPLRMEALRAAQILLRLARCTEAYMAACVGDVTYSAFRLGLNLRRSLDTNTSLDRGNVLKQLSGIGPAAVRQLREAGVSTFEQCRALHPRTLEAALRRNPPFGSSVHDELSRIPNLSMDARLVDSSLVVAAGPKAPTSDTPVGKGEAMLFLLVGTERPGTVQIRRFQWASGSRVEYRFSLPGGDGRTGDVQALLGPDNVVGADISTAVALDSRKRYRPVEVETVKSQSALTTVRSKKDAIPKVPVQRLVDRRKQQAAHGAQGHLVAEPAPPTPPEPAPPAAPGRQRVNKLESPNSSHNREEEMAEYNAILASLFQ